MKIAVNVLAVLICAAVLFFGQLHWNEKVAGSTSEKLATGEESGKKGTDTIRLYAQNLPSAVVQKIEKAYESQQPLRFIIVSSGSLGTGDASWPILFKEKLEEIYGEDVFTITVKQYENMTTKDMVTEGVGGELKALKPDILLFQPPMIADNGVVGIKNTLDNLEILVNDIKGSDQDVSLMIQPPQPLYQTIFYPKDIEALQNFAKERSIFYLDHWKEWPDSQSDELLQYVEEDRIAPNEKGNQLWASFLTNIFVHKAARE